MIAIIRYNGHVLTISRTQYGASFKVVYILKVLVFDPFREDRKYLCLQLKVQRNNYYWEYLYHNI